MIEAAVVQGQVKGIRISPMAPIISNLCFADDTVLFSQATTQEAECIRGILNRYAEASCQIINMEKSTMVFSPNTSSEMVTAIQQIVHFQVVHQFERYLGLPTHIGRSKLEVFNYLKDKLWARVSGWGEKHLSMARRETLIKAVLEAIPTYVMSCFKLPKGILEEAEKIIRRLWWGSKNSKGITWLSWAKLCRPKVNGGMGCRDLECFNLALLAKQAWRITTNPDLLLSRILKATYFPRTTFRLAVLGECPSLTKRSILEARPFLELGMRRRIGNGRSTHIWVDPWLLEEGSGKVITRRPMSSSFPDLVSDFIDAISGSWDLDLLSQYLWPCDVARVLKVPVGTNVSEDENYWFHSKNGNFTIRSYYHMILEHAERVELASSGTSNVLEAKEWKWVWGLQLPPKIRTFL